MSGISVIYPTGLDKIIFRIHLRHSATPNFIIFNTDKETDLKRIHERNLSYLLRTPFKVDTYNYVHTSITGSSSYCKSKKKISSCSMITLNCVPSLVSAFFDTPDITVSIKTPFNTWVKNTHPNPHVH
jgi:hypothetical protein